VQPLQHPLTIALSAPWHACPDRLTWIAEHGFAVEYAPDPDALDKLHQHIDPLLHAGIPVRYHGFFPDHEIGHKDAAVAEHALQVQMAALEAMHGRGQQVITVHVGLNRMAPLDPGRVVENLARLAERGRDLGITICLENLRRGPTSDPGTVSAWAEAAGAMITLDIGHAISCQQVQDGELTVSDFFSAFGSRLWEVHMYERETDKHHPPRDMSILGPILNRLLETRCSWWTIELDDYAEALSTRSLLFDYLHARGWSRSPAGRPGDFLFQRPEKSSIGAGGP
jgi:sugar phosphate isomerase/epimerase